jgi:hypothetical protein
MKVVIKPTTIVVGLMSLKDQLKKEPRRGEVLPIGLSDNFDA